MQADVIEKIRKLLALGRSPNPHESALAISKAHELMEQYDIAEAQVSYDPAGYTTESAYSYRRNLGTEMRYVASLLMRHFHVEAFTEKTYVGGRWQSEVRLFGFPHHVEIAKHVCVYLCRCFRDHWRVYRRDHCGRREWLSAESFYQGLATGVDLELLRRRPTSSMAAGEKNALVLSRKHRVDAFLATIKPGRSSHRSKGETNGAAFLSGFEKGKEIPVVDAVGSTCAEPLKLGSEKEHK